MPWSSVEPLASKLHWPRRQRSVKLAYGGWSVTGGGGCEDAPPPVYRSRFGDPVPMLASTPLVALLVKARATSAGEAAGFVSRYSAAAPATWGEAIEVPLKIAVATSLV